MSQPACTPYVWWQHARNYIDALKHASYNIVRRACQTQVSLQRGGYPTLALRVLTAAPRIHVAPLCTANFMVNPTHDNPTFDGNGVPDPTYSDGPDNAQPYMQADPDQPRVYVAEKAARLSKHAYADVDTEVRGHQHTMPRTCSRWPFVPTGFVLGSGGGSVSSRTPPLPPATQHTDCFSLALCCALCTQTHMAMQASGWGA